MPQYMCLLQHSLIIKQSLLGADLERLRHLKVQALAGRQRNAKLLQYHLQMANLYLIALLKELNMKVRLKVMI